MGLDRLVIIGNGGAAINGIIAARNAGFKGEVHQVADTDSSAFNPMLSPYYLKGTIPWHQCFPYGDDFYQKYDVTRHFGSPVASLDAVKKTIGLQNGEELSYDKCLIATGASPIIPPVPGLRESAAALPLRSAENTAAIEQVAEKSHKVVIMGASLVGVKLAEIMKKKGLDIILVDIAPRMLPQGSHPESADYLKEYFIKKGIDVRLSCGITKVEDKGDKVICHFPDDTAEEADFIAVCTGVRPNLDFLDKNQVDIDIGILVDKKMRTSVADLYAAGDVCQGLNRQTNQSAWMGTWGNACYQGRTAGMNMAGQDSEYEGIIPQHISPFFDWTYAQMGDVSLEGDDIRIVSEGNPFEGAYRLFVFQEDILVGANLINCEEESGVIKNSIVNRTKFSFTVDTIRNQIFKGLM